ncbi:MAG: T9SS type A sorting domain-containing protein [Bacteroidales bacterium]|nr:T9SS type A sorting domain-containing protein [Bacteroidales bacterium]
MKHFLLTILLVITFSLQGALTSPWVGGLNACQFGRMDLDGDGRKDLLVFDRHGNRLLCYLNKGTEREIRYEYTTEYDASFPKLNGWVVFADYNGDGKEDIFTYSKGWAGIKVYRNVSTSGQPEFALVVSPYLTSWQGWGEVNLLATDADYPAIVDLDGDGDLDILTFGVMGTFIEKHLNLSVERYGHRDSLLFERTDLCWGRVAESEEDNVMYLDTCLFGYGLKVDREDFRHRGATVCVRDLNGDGLLDLLLADVDYPGLTLLVNGGDAENALMVSQTEQFPLSTPVNLPSMPVPFFTDINNDGIDDLLVSPFDPNPMASVGKESVWLYLNHGTNEAPDFQLYSKSFLQEQMLEFGIGAYPTVVDWDGDGLLDLVMGSIDGEHLNWLRNVGASTVPVYHVEDFPMDFGGYTGLVPAFYDLDTDGQQELLVGTSEGRLMLYDHDGTLLDGDYLHYDKAWSAPCFYDVDRDGNVDLVVGNITGKLSFFKRKTENGTPKGSPTEWEVKRKTEGGFGRLTDYWGGVDVRDYNTSYYGYSVPTLFQYGDETLLAVGSESGKVFLFDGVSAEDDVPFREVPERWTELCEAMPATFGMRSAATLNDLDDDGQLEVVVGNFAGGLQLFNAEIAVNNLGISESHEDYKVEIFPNPVTSQIHIISKEENIKMLMVADLYGRRLMELSVGGKDATLEVSALSEGVYLLVFELDRGLVSRIFLKR